VTATNPDLVCRRVVEITTDYMEGALPAEERARFEQHLLVCAGCVGYVEQARAAVRVLGAIGSERTEPPSTMARELALRAFRSLRKGDGT
jgi:anti-sigma factor RsiW